MKINQCLVKIDYNYLVNLSLDLGMTKNLGLELTSLVLNSDINSWIKLLPSYPKTNWD